MNCNAVRVSVCLLLYLFLLSAFQLYTEALSLAKQLVACLRTDADGQSREDTEHSASAPLIQPGRSHQPQRSPGLNSAAKKRA